VATKQANVITSNSTSLKSKYLDVLQKDIVEPLRRDLAQRQQEHRAAGDKKGEQRFEKLEKTLDSELDRLRKLRLSDFG